MALLRRGVFPATLIFFLMVAWPVLSAPPADSVPWYGTLEEATSAAKESGRPILVDFWADWCAACKVMDKNVYSDPAFVEAARGFVTVRINYDQKTAIARKYNVAELPTLVFTDSWGGEIFRHTGYLDGRLLAELLHSLPTDISAFNRLDAILARNKNDFGALREMGADLRAAGLFLASSEYYARALETKESKTVPADRAAILTGMGANSLELKDGQQAAATFERCLKEFPGNAQSAAWTLGLGNAYVLADKKDKAKKILEDLVSQHPGSAESEKAKALLASL